MLDSEPTSSSMFPTDHADGIESGLEDYILHEENKKDLNKMSIHNHGQGKWLELVSSFKGNTVSKKTQVSSLKFEVANSTIACGYSDGMIRTYDLEHDHLSTEVDTDLTPSWMVAPPEQRYPITAMAWLFKSAMRAEDPYRQKTLLTASGDGKIKFWDITKKATTPHNKIDETETGGTYTIDANYQTS